MREFFSHGIARRFSSIAFAFAFAITPAFAFADGSQSYTSPGTYTFNVPQGVNSITVQVWGGGGGGSGGSIGPSYGGGGGGYSTQTYSPGQLPPTVTVVVG